MTAPQDQPTGPLLNMLLAVAEHAVKGIPEAEFFPHSWWEQPKTIRVKKSNPLPAAMFLFRGCVLGHFIKSYPTIAKNACGLELFGKTKHRSPWVKGELPGINSVAHAFRIPLADAIALFLPSSYDERAGKLDYAHRIESYVRNQQSLIAQKEQI